MYRICSIYRADSTLHLLIVTKEEERAIEEDGKRTEVKPAWKLLLPIRDSISWIGNTFLDTFLR